MMINIIDLISKTVSNLEVDTGELAEGVRVDVHRQFVAHIHGSDVP